MPTQDELFAAVDALLEEEPQLPPPAERARLREAAGITQSRLAQVLKSTLQTVKNWENGRSEPRPPRLQAYQRLLEGWAAKYPKITTPAPAAGPASETFASRIEQPAPVVPAEEPAPAPAAPAAAAPAEVPQQQPGPMARRTAPHRPAKKTTPTRPAVDPRFPHGPLAVLDGDGSAYCTGGVVLECPATTIPQLVDWTLKESGIGAPRLHRNGKDSDPLVVLTASAAVKLGLPERLEGFEARRSLRLPEDHPVVKQITKTRWQLTQRGFGPWPRIYRTAQGSERQCVQLAILPWDALDTRSWPGVSDLPPAELARVLGTYAERVITPRGSTAVSGLELMTALRPPTRAVRDEQSGEWVSGYNPGSLGSSPVDPAPPEATPEHPVVVESGWTGGFLDEEAYQWVRDVDLLSADEVVLPFAVGLDINTAFLAAAARLTVGLSGPEHVQRPRFDKKAPGSWYVDLSHIQLDPRLPSPFTPSGKRPEGPAWYETHTVAYAVELGYDIQPAEAYLRRQTGAYLDPWHDRLKSAYVDTMADLGVTADLDDQAFLAAMEHHKQVDPGMAAVLAAIKATVKGGVGKLRERPQGRHYRDGERWPALERPTWRPDIRAAVISKARVNMHRKILKTAEATGLYPLAVLSDCVVYPSPGQSPLDFLPYTTSGKPLPGSFRLGCTPGLVKVEGVQEMPWAVDLMEQGLNPARHIKDGHDAVLEGGE
ncbi:helix-turn-helix domain-containing protein [Streptomyces sp. NRRL B-1677]|uniref:XRE family transcriptional regulator n=1 Tax=Streptomyces klenkii TaxID=1420899 RepID=A0A3B0AFN8_9ACTN|nr:MULTISPECIES: helix-turn-helix transcriptional regulator [Streptomyces]MBF6050049.1 helix-turn-helix domain-containing protein [Streptomyces sp. NRRL B-1677]RKN59648.1 XRE family transcriptional regulator [Streptomyces klenkii]